jgi:hypothetical protein
VISSLNGTQLNSVAEAGGWIIAKNNLGQIFNRHAITSDPTDLNTREEMVRVNVDSISFSYKEVYLPYIGQVNVTPDTITVLNSLFDTTTLVLKTNGTPKSGPQLIDATLVQIRQHALFKDRVVIEANLSVPYPLNNIDLKLVV